MAFFWSASRAGLYDDAEHGTRKHDVPDPNWTRPTIADPQWVPPLVADPDWVRPADADENATAPMIPDASAVAPLVPDYGASHPTVEAANPDCHLPDDAEQISARFYAELMAARAGGKDVVADDKGRPVVRDRAPSDEETAARAREARDGKLRACDWTALLDVALSDTQRAAWFEYRKALREVTKQPGWPRTIAWPIEPTE